MVVLKNNLKFSFQRLWFKIELKIKLLVVKQSDMNYIERNHVYFQYRALNSGNEHNRQLPAFDSLHSHTHTSVFMGIVKNGTDIECAIFHINKIIIK